MEHITNTNNKKNKKLIDVFGQKTPMTKARLKKIENKAVIKNITKKNAVKNENGYCVKFKHEIELNKLFQWSVKRNNRTITHEFKTKRDCEELDHLHLLAMELNKVFPLDIIENIMLSGFQYCVKCKRYDTRECFLCERTLIIKNCNTIFFEDNPFDFVCLKGLIKVDKRTNTLLNFNNQGLSDFLMDYYENIKRQSGINKLKVRMDGENNYFPLKWDEEYKTAGHGMYGLFVKGLVSQEYMPYVDYSKIKMKPRINKNCITIDLKLIELTGLYKNCNWKKTFSMKSDCKGVFKIGYAVDNRFMVKWDREGLS